MFGLSRAAPIRFKEIHSLASTLFADDVGTPARRTDFLMPNMKEESLGRLALRFSEMVAEQRVYRRALGIL